MLLLLLRTWPHNAQNVSRWRVKPKNSVMLLWQNHSAASWMILCLYLLWQAALIPEEAKALDHWRVVQRA